MLCSRRLVLVLTTVFLNRFYIGNIIVYIYGSIYLLGYYTNRKPFDKRWAYWLELFNETFIIISAYFIFIFTNWISYIQTRYQLGLFFVDITTWVIIINQLGIIYETSYGIRMWSIKRKYYISWKKHFEYKSYLVQVIVEA